MVTRNNSIRGLDRNALIRRQREQARQRRIIEQQRALEEQQRQQTQQVAFGEGLKQDALSFLLRTGKANDSFRALSPREQSEIQDLANELERTGSRIQAERQVTSIEEQLGQRLDPKTREALIKETLQTGRASLSISQFEEGSLGGFQGPVPAGFSESAFRASGRLKVETPSKRFQGPVPRFTDPEFFFESGKKRQLPLVVSGVKGGTFKTDFSKIKRDIIRASKEGNIPQILRSSIADTTTVLTREAQRRARQQLIDLGIGKDSIIVKEFPSRVSSAEIIGGSVLGAILLDPLATGTTAIGVSRYVKNGVVYEIDNAGNVIASRKLSEVKAEANKNILEFKNLLDESAVFKKADSFYPNEANLRMRTRELIKKASTNPKQLQALKNLYRKANRKDLFEDIFEQEIGQIRRTNQVSRASFRPVTDRAVQLKGSGVATSTSKFAGTGLYERSEAVGFVNKTRDLQRQGLIPLSLEAIRQQFRLEQMQLKQQLLSQGLSPQTIQRELLRLQQFQIEQIRQQSRQRQGLRFGLAQRSGLQQQLQLRQRLQSRFAQKQRGGERFRPRFGRPFKIPPPFSGSNTFGNRIRRTTEAIRNKFDVFAKKKGKLIRINTKPIIGKAASIDYLAERLDRTLRASGTTRPSARSGFARIPKATTGYLKRNAQKFYTNKKTGFLVEKRKYRIEKQDRGELREIKAAKAFAPKYKPFKRL